MKINESKIWNFNFNNSTIHFEFTQSVDIRKAFDSMRATTVEPSWIDELSGIDTDSDTFEMDNIMYADDGIDEIFISVLKAVAETFPSVSFAGNMGYSCYECYCEIDMEFTYINKKLHVIESFVDERCGYCCPECGFMVVPYNEVIEEEEPKEEIECSYCDEVIKVSDLKYVPPIVTKSEFIIE